MTPAPRILSISSDPSVFETRNQVLAASGYDVVGCFRGEGALETFSSESFDAVVVGDSVSVQTRAALLQAFRRLRPSVPLIVIQRTGSSEDATDADAIIESLDGPQRLIQVLSSLVETPKVRTSAE